MCATLSAPADAPAERLLAPDQAVEKKTGDGHDFETDVAMTNFLILPAQALGVPAWDFAGRCGKPAVWMAVFQIEGQIPNVGDVWGSASHCAYKQDPADPTELPTYADGQGWLRSANGDDVDIEYGNGTNFPVEGGLVAFRDDWRFTGGTGRFQNVSGSGIDYGKYDPADVMNPDPSTRFPYRMSGTVDYDAAARGLAANFRATFNWDMTLPYVVAGNPTEDPCWQKNPGQHTTIMDGEGTATRLGPFTTHAEFCYDWEAGEGDPRIHHGVTASGATFEWLCDELALDLPFFAPGLDRVYAFRAHEALTGLTGNLEGVQIDIHSVGTMLVTWHQTPGGPVADYPARAEQQMAGTWVRN